MNYEPVVDTLRIVERLEGAGTPSEQARMLATVLAELISTERKRVYARCVSRHEFARQMALIRTRLDEIDSKIDLLRADVTSLEQRVFAEMRSLEERVFAEMRSLNERVFTEIESLEKRVSSEAKSLEERLRSETRASVSEARESLVRWIVGAGILQSGFLTALALLRLD